jgi:hypothetical protein
MEAIMRESDDGKRGGYIFRSTVRLRVAKLARVTERVGLAMVGASCGLFVAVVASHASNEILRSLGVSFAMIVIGALGFYLGIDVPSPPAQAGEQPLFSDSATTKIDSVEVLSAAGTFLAATAAVVSVCLIVFDADLQTPWTQAFGFSWLIGAAMQVIAGTAARVRNSARVQLDGARKYGRIGEQKGPALSPTSF